MSNYGDGDASFQAAGGAVGIAALVRDFYTNMESLPQAATILAMHSPDLSESIEKLTVFLTGWLGGPKNYTTKFGRIQIPAAHKHLTIDDDATDAWMQCMTLAVGKQDAWSEDFKSYFLVEIAVPAERVRQVSGRSL